MRASDWETTSQTRLEARRVIRRVVEEFGRGPVGEMSEADLKDLRAAIRREYQGERKGGRYRAWRTEVKLAMGAPDPLKAVRSGGGKKKPAAQGLTREQRVMLGGDQ